LTAATEVKRAEGRIAALANGRSPEVLSKPRKGWSP
jgi:hypothetical protein